MQLDNPSLVFDLVEWVAQGPRSYRDVMDAWRTSCPRLTIWEDAIDHGLVAQAPDANGHTIVVITARGREFLAATQRSNRAGGTADPARTDEALSSVGR